MPTSEACLECNRRRYTKFAKKHLEKDKHLIRNLNLLGRE